MARLGHSSVRAAMIYQHATRDRDQAIVRALGTFVRDVRGPTTEPPGKAERGEQGARGWHPCGTYVARGARDHRDRPELGVRAPPLTWAGGRERATGIEPA